MGKSWEQRKLGEICQSFDYGLNAPAKEFDGKNKYIRITDIDDDTRTFLEKDLSSPNCDLNLADNYRLKDGDILFARTGASVGKTYKYRNSDGLVYYAGFLIRARVKESYSPTFIFYNTFTPHYERFIRVTSQRSGQPGVNAEEYSNFTLWVPTYEEQEQIGFFFSNLDNLITLHQHQLDLLKEQKKGLLQKMFPKEGASEPELRFPEFTDSWEQRKFFEIAKVRRGLTYSPKDIRDTGIRVLRSSNITEDQFFLNDDDVFVTPSAVNIPYVENGDILITAANGSARLVGKHSIIKDISQKSAIHGGFMLVASSKNPDFVNALMSTPWYTKFINLHVRGGNGAIGNLSKNDLNQQIIRIPSTVEQEQIGFFFSNFDQLITLHQRKLELLKEQKKGLLQKMFPKKGEDAPEVRFLEFR